MITTSVPIGGVSGATGGVAAKLLLEKGILVRALVRSDDERTEKLRARR
jgi:NAD(P)H dehydrogenase (quinone)